jgi:peptidyl-prolyl cis-trans isomerase B (cyclophilin B)
MSKPDREREPPAAFPSVGAAVLLMLAVVVGLLIWFYVAMTAGGPRPASGRTVACVSPPPPPSSVPRFSAAPDPALAEGARWTATLETTCGRIVIELDGSAAPRTVASFVQLARGGYWTDSVCHRLTSRTAPTAFLQCGDPTGQSQGDPGYGLPAEHVPTDGRYSRTTVAMARGAGIETTAGEFMMVYEDFTVLPGDPVYPVFGRVVDGMEVVDAIAAEGGEDTRPDGPPFTSISIRTVDVARR